MTGPTETPSRPPNVVDSVVNLARETGANAGVRIELPDGDLHIHVDVVHPHSTDLWVGLADSVGVAAIAAERVRQVELGYDEHHDQQHTPWDLWVLAFDYLVPWAARGDVIPGLRERFVKAGALLAAAIDRLDVADRDVVAQDQAGGDGR